jgi:type II secretory pathway pseudopilin PulG
MTNTHSRGYVTNRREQGGYSMLMVVFLVATMIILSAVATQSVLTTGRREREAEMVWRGEQYQHAIGLYFRKFGRYPGTIEDLTKQTNGMRFLRQAYTDPTNKDDGSWRMIYVGPGGILIGSSRAQTLLQLQMAATSPGGQAGSAPSGSSEGLHPLVSPTDPSQAQAQPIGGTVVGGSIIGVGSKTKGESLLVYKGASDYEKWEFIWQPVGLPFLPNQNNGPPLPAPGAPSPTPPPAQ